MDQKNLRRGKLYLPAFIPLRYRFIIMSAGMLIVLLTSLALVIDFLQSRTIRRQLETRGLSIAQSLAATSADQLLTYDYIALERSANQAAQDPDVIRVIFHDKEGRVAGYSSRPDLQNTFLEDKASRLAIKTGKPMLLEAAIDDGPSALEAVVPVYPPGTQSRWGTVRVALSLVPLRQQLRQIKWIILVTGLIALTCGTLMSLWAARRITKPLDNLVKATREAAKGDLNQNIQAQTGDEVEVLAENFAAMIQEIVAHRGQLERQLQEIKRLQEYTQKLLTTMSDGLLTVDMAGKVTGINPSAEKILGAESRPNVQFRHDQVLDAHPPLRAYFHSALKNTTNPNPHEIQIDVAGEVRSLLVNYSILRDRQSQPQEIIINLHDISTLKKLAASVRQAERLAALGTLAAGMAHEIRNPLSSIKTFVQLLPKKHEKPGFLAKFQRTVPRELNRINNLVEDLLDLARTPKYQFRKTAVQSLLTQTIEIFGEEFNAGRIRCRCEMPDNLPPVTADANQLSKAFHNLIRNAVQAMPSGGDLLIRASCVGGSSAEKRPDEVGEKAIEIVFEDTGSGIAAEAVKNIFNPFFTTKEKGTGLGLAITHKVIAEHGGRIEVETREECGTQFIVRIPVHQTA